jgi:hypothetical protein
MHRFKTITKAGFLGSMALALMPLGCGGMEPTIRQQQSPTPEHPAVPPKTAERLQECVKEHGYQLEGGPWAFSPTIQVDREGYVVNVNAGEMPKTAPDLAACTRIALGDMAIPSYFFNLRQKQSDTATSESTMAQRSYMGSPAVVVVVVVGLSEIVLEAGAVTILFAVTVKVVDKAVDDVADLVKRRRIWRDQCADDYTDCIASPAGRARGNHWNMTRCGTCREVCEKNEGIWPSTVPLFPEPAVSCY